MTQGRKTRGLGPSDRRIGAQIASLRKAIGITGIELAKDMKELGLRWSPPTVAQVEHGRRRLTPEEVACLSWYFDEDLLADLAPSREQTKSAAVERSWLQREDETREEARRRARVERLADRDLERYPGPTYVMVDDVSKRRLGRIREAELRLFELPSEDEQRGQPEQLSLTGLWEGEPYVARDDLEAAQLAAWEEEGLVRRISRQQAKSMRDARRAGKGNRGGRGRD